MDAQLTLLIESQAEQNRLLKEQLRWLKFGLLASLVLATASICCLGFLIRNKGAANRNLTVVTTEPILEHPISVAETDSTQLQFPTMERLQVPPMLKTGYTAPIELSFPEYRPGPRCDGMCL